MQEKLKKLTKKYPKLRKVFIFFLEKLEKENTQKILEKMQTLMKTSDIDESLKLVQK